MPETLHPDFQPMFDVVREVNPGETEFQQAVYEVMLSIAPLARTRPEYAQWGILKRICEPERQIIFRVPWVTDDGKIEINRGYRVEFNSALGVYKGGLRFHPSVNLSIIKFLGFEQTFKNSLPACPSRRQGRRQLDPRPVGRRDHAVLPVVHDKLYRHIGEYTDVPAGDIGVGGRGSATCSASTSASPTAGRPAS